MKDAKGHGSNSRGGGDYAKSASGQPGYNPRVQGGGRMFGRQPTAAERAQNSQAVSDFAAKVALAQGGTKSGDVPVHSGARGLTPVQSENVPFVSRLGGHSFLDPHDPRARRK